MRPSITSASSPTATAPGFWDTVYPFTTPMGTSCAASRESCLLDDRDDPLDVLVGERRLLGQTAVGRAAHDDALRLELAAQLRAGDLAPRTSAAHPPPAP